MKKSTFRIVKSIGIVLFLVLFGALIYFLTKPQADAQKVIALSPETNPEDFEIIAGTTSQRTRIGFDYQKNAEDGTLDTQI